MLVCLQPSYDLVHVVFAGEPISVLDGVPIAVKDEIDCLPYPTTGRAMCYPFTDVLCTRVSVVLAIDLIFTLVSKNAPFRRYKVVAQRKALYR